MADGVVFDEQTARDLVALVRHYRRNGLLPVKPSRALPTFANATPYYVHNASGGEIPAYACMQITGTEEIAGQNFLLADQPADVDGTSGWYLFNGPRAIADNEEGIAQPGPVVRAFKNTGTITAGDHWAPVASQWYIAADTDGPFIAAGADDVDDDVLRVFTGSGGAGGGGVTFWRFTLNANWSAGVAAADILEMDGTDTTTDANVRDPLGIFSALANGDAGICFLQDGLYYAIQAPCP